MNETRYRTFLAGIIIFCIMLFYWTGPLMFFPMPWPDDSAFFLPGLDLVSWPPRYQMLSQSPFVPSYRDANFNTMPGLPLLLGFFAQLGWTSTFSVRFFGCLAFASLIFLLYYWMKFREAPRALRLAITAAALFSPSLTWGMMLVRPEIWIGLALILLLMEVDRVFQPSRWRAPLILAISAYIHFEAVYWVLPLCVAFSLKRLVDIAWRTTLLLSPWLLYVFFHFDQFKEQMGIQFHRLDAHHQYFDSFLSFIHSVFQSYGNPLQFEKWYNLAKITFWLLSLTAIIYGWVHIKKPLARAALIAFMSTLYLWATKPETWFTTLIHASFFGLWAALACIKQGKLNSKLQQATSGLFAILALLGLSTLASRTLRSMDHFTKKNFTAWTDCIHETTSQAQNIWQPGEPDVLVNLAGKDRQARVKGRQFFRHDDFLTPIEQQRAFVHTLDAIVHTEILENWQSTDPKMAYSGEARPVDTERLRSDPWLAAPEFTAIKMNAQAKHWNLKICQNGPFWAVLSLRKSPL